MECLKIGQKAQLNEICNMYNACKESLLKNKIFQWGDWDNNYPDRNYLQICIEKKKLFLFTLNENLIGAVVLNEYQPPEWNSIPWNESDGQVLVVHAMVIHPEHQNKGHGKQLILLCEKHATDNGYNIVQLDSFNKNTVANKLYRSLGYNNLGSVIFDVKPEDNKEYFCYEKLLYVKSKN